MKYRKEEAIALLLAALIFLSPCLIPQSYAAYSNGYSGGMAGDDVGIYAHGVDLSAWQGDSVDFNRIKSQGYSFVILRAGYATSIDRTFENNYSRAKEAGLDVGVYLYSYADNTEEAAEEAEACKAWLAGKKLEYPVYYDVEDPQCHGDMSVELLTQIALTFLDELSADGWLVGLYSCKSWLENRMDTATICENYECWMAQFVSDGTYDGYDCYDGEYGMWQYTSSGSVEGVPAGVDMNVCFKDYPSICRQYGFNGYEAAGESLYLTGVAAAERKVIKTGESVTVNGYVGSSKGNLSNVTVGIFDETGKMLTGRSGSSQNTSFDLSQLAAGVQTEKLSEGKYYYRIIASNTYETRTLLNQELWISDCGAVAENVEIPCDLKEGDVFLPVGQLLSKESMESVNVSVKSLGGSVYCEASSLPDGIEFDLSELSGEFDTSQLTMGSYRYCVEAYTHNGVLTLVSKTFSVWKKNDPLTLTDFELHMEYYPGELAGLPGVVNSQSSRIRELEVCVYNSSEECVARAWTRKNAKSTVLSDVDEELELESLPIGVYRCEITAINSGGPATLLNTTFRIRNDNISLCGLSAPRMLYEGDSFFLEGMVACDVSALEVVTVNVYDTENKCVLSAAKVPNRSFFDLSTLNDSLRFSDLSCGEYILRITVKNERDVDTLYDAPFAVIDSQDLIVRSENCMDPVGISYTGSIPYVLEGSLTSRYSDISLVSVDILDVHDTVLISVSTQPEAPEFDLTEFNEMLRLSALPTADYRIRISAENAQGCFVLMDSAFSVSSCLHSNVRAGIVYQASCSLNGVVCNSCCQDCGESARRGLVLEKTYHSYNAGRCEGCSRMEFISVCAEQTAQLPKNYDRIVITVKSGENWYALGMDATAVPISGPDENGRISVTADLLWTVSDSSRGYYLSNPFDRKLHLDSTDITVAKGPSNSDLVLSYQGDAWKIALKSENSHCLTYLDDSFSVGDEGAEFFLFLYLPDP